MAGSENTVKLLQAVLVSGGAIGVVLAFIFQYVPFASVLMRRLSWRQRRWAVFVACLLVPLVAAAGLVLLGASPNVPDTWTGALVAGVAAITSSQVTHGVLATSNDD